MKNIILLTLVLSSFSLAGCGEKPENQPGYISRADLGADWPLTVESAVIGHDAAGGVTLTINGTTYAVNGTAMGEKRYPDISDSGYWAPDPTSPGLKKSIGPIIKRGQELPQQDQ